MSQPKRILHTLLPHLLEAGRYAARVQSTVSRRIDKGGATPFHQALSDADLSVQAFLEIPLLANFPEVSFFSEEQEHSLNHKHFPVGASLEVLLDPIDGTRSYLDGKPDFQIIVAVHSDKELVGAATLMPRQDFCLIAAKGEGVMSFTSKAIEQRSAGTPYRLPECSGPVLLFNAPEFTQNLSTLLAESDPKFITEGCVDLVTAYEQFPNKHASTDLLRGKAVGTIHHNCQAIDGGAIGFIVQEAGGVMCDFEGNPAGNFRKSELRTLPNIFTASSREVADELLSYIQKIR